jgi:hypothetical protein
VLDGGVVQVKRSVAFKILEARIYVRPLEKDDAASLRSDELLSKGVRCLRRRQVPVIQGPVEARPHALLILQVDVHAGVAEDHPDVFDRRGVGRRARKVEHGAPEPVAGVDIEGRGHGRAQGTCLRPGLAPTSARRGGLGAGAVQRAVESMLVSLCEVGMERAHTPRGGAGVDLCGSLGRPPQKIGRAVGLGEHSALAVCLRPDGEGGGPAWCCEEAGLDRRRGRRAQYVL